MAVDLSGFGQIALNIGMILVSLIFFIGFTIATFYFVSKYKRYSQYKCVIWGRDGFGQITQTTDSAGIFVDRKTRNKRFFLKNNKVGLEPDNVPYVQQGNKKVVYLLRNGLKNFRFVKPNIDFDSVSLEVGEEDVNWAVNAYERQKKVFSQNLLLQYMPFIALGFTSIIILIIFIYLFKQFGVLKALGVSLKETANIISQAKTGTRVLT